MRTRAITVLLVILLLGIGGTVVATNSFTPESPAPAETDAATNGPVVDNKNHDTNITIAENEIHETQNITLAGTETGYYRQTITYNIGDKVQRLTVIMNGDNIGGIKIESLTGFSRVTEGNTRYTWDRQTQNPTITLRVPANKTNDRFNGFDFIDTGNWAIVKPPSTTMSYGWNRGETDEPDTTRDITTTPDNLAGDDYVLLGDITQQTRIINGQSFHVGAVNEEGINDTFETAFNRLTTVANTFAEANNTAHPQTVFIVTDPVRRGGLAEKGARDFWAHKQDIDGGVLEHEFVHTQQTGTTGRNLGWTTEAEATYYQEVFQLARGEISYEEFQVALSIPDTFNQTVISNRQTWKSEREYEVAPAAVGHIETVINKYRQNASYSDIFVQRTKHGQPLGLQAYLRDYVTPVVAGGEQKPTQTEAQVPIGQNLTTDMATVRNMLTEPIGNTELNRPTPVAYDIGETNATYDIAAPSLGVLADGTTTYTVGITNTGTEAGRPLSITVTPPDGVTLTPTEVKQGVKPVEARDEQGYRTIRDEYVFEGLPANETIRIEFTATSSTTDTTDLSETQISVNDVNGNIANAAVKTTEIEPTEVTITAPDEVTTGANTTITATPTGTPQRNYTYDWQSRADSGEYTRIRDENATIRHVFRQPGTYTLIVETTDKYGITDRTTQKITVTGNPIGGSANEIGPRFTVMIAGLGAILTLGLLYRRSK